jgi:hypothetical protein
LSSVPRVFNSSESTTFDRLTHLYPLANDITHCQSDGYGEACGSRSHHYPRLPKLPI